MRSSNTGVEDLKNQVLDSGDTDDVVRICFVRVSGVQILSYMGSYVFTKIIPQGHQCCQVNGPRVVAVVCGITNGLSLGIPPHTIPKSTDSTTTFMSAVGEF